MGNGPDRHQRSAFVLAAVGGHAMIVNRLDYQAGDHGAGVGACLLEYGSHEATEIQLLGDLATFRCNSVGPGVVVIDGGANIGTHTVALAKRMTGWGEVMAFEPQERVYYALAGNVALNNCFNASARRTLLADTTGHALIPQLDHQRPANFGGLSMKQGIRQDPGQPVLFDKNAMAPAATVAIDDLNLKRLDILKLDIEGMEPDALRGAAATIERCKPIVYVEIATCGNVAAARELPEYEITPVGMSAIGVHRSDPLASSIKIVDGCLSIELERQ